MRPYLETLFRDTTLPVSHLLSACSPLVSLFNNPSDPSELDLVNGPPCAAQVSVDGLGRSHIRWHLQPCTPCSCKSSRARACTYIYVYSLDPCSHLRLTQLSAGVLTAIRGSPSPLPDGGWSAFCVIFNSRFISAVHLSMRSKEKLFCET